MDFEEYITQGEPGRKERAENWQVAIGLQAVDGLKPSRYLLQTAQDHIEERIGIAPVAACDALQDFDEAGDFSLYTYPDEDATWVVLHPGDFCVTPPADAHKPACCGPAGPAELRKVCVKVRL